jgi:predicted dehydrogenase
VVTRRQATGAVVLDALRSGRHVLSEKPMAHQSQQGRMLAETAAAGKRVYAVGYMKRHDAGIVRAKAELDRILRDGSLGALVSVRGWCFGGNTGGFADGFVMTREDRPDGLSVWRSGPDWLPDRLLRNYDAFLNVNVHIINLMRHLMGGTPSVLATAMRDDGTGTTRLDFAGVPGVLDLAGRAQNHSTAAISYRCGGVGRDHGSHVEVAPAGRKLGVPAAGRCLHPRRYSGSETVGIGGRCCRRSLDRRGDLARSPQDLTRNHRLPTDCLGCSDRRRVTRNNPRATPVAKVRPAGADGRRAA